jgi:RecA/RadA recombinase
LAANAKETRDRRTAMGQVAARFAGFRPGLEVLTAVRGVRTIFPAVDLATRVGGWPIERVAVVHGVSSGGKTEFALGLGHSFLLRDHFFSLVDAEQTTPEDWIRQMMSDSAGHPGFSAVRPKSYEETVDHVRRWAETIAEARLKREIPEDTTGICVVDSIGKLRPKRLLKAIMAAAADEGDGSEERAKDPRRRKTPGGIDGMAGRAGQYKAFLNAAWLDDLVPLMAHTGTAIVLITRESESADGGLFGPDYHVTGGRHLVYDASLRVRIVPRGPIWRGEGADRQMVGERHTVEVHKTKVAKRTERIPTGDFCTSNGVLVPEGFDLARDLLDVGQELGLVELRGAWYSFGGERIACGEHAAVRALHDAPATLAALDAAVRAQVDQVLDGERAARRPAAE